MMLGTQTRFAATWRDGPGVSGLMDLPVPGITYAPTRPGSTAKPRTVAWAGEAPPALGAAFAFVSGYASVGYRFDTNPSHAHWPDTGHDSWEFVGAWRAWVRKHAAVAVTP